ncbi:MAG: XcyI family restriction endonuclease [Eubacteriales bacterium]|nr:XcyI family restriction endonuclease [Eubacteriales bacterium]
MSTAQFNIPDPEIQISFGDSLTQIRRLYLQEALSSTVQSMDISVLDRELATHVPPASLAKLAGHGLRGELMFVVPSLLETNPYLIGYYRLLLGFSRKAFYTKDFGLTGFANMEDKGQLPEAIKANLGAFCQAMIRSACVLLDHTTPTRLTPGYLDDLTLLTLGPQLRGGANVRRGTAGIQAVFETIHTIVQHAVLEAKPNRLEILNSAGRKVLIEFAADPDIIIREEMTTDNYRHVIAVEVKGGTDFSNIHNRIGEAEKSHQKARRVGYTECWTVVNVDRIDLKMARKESPTTNRFYRLSSLLAGAGDEYEDFRNRIISYAGITS